MSHDRDARERPGHGRATDGAKDGGTPGKRARTQALPAQRGAGHDAGGGQRRGDSTEPGDAGPGLSAGEAEVWALMAGQAPAKPATAAGRASAVAAHAQAVSEAALLAQAAIRGSGPLDPALGRVRGALEALADALHEHSGKRSAADEQALRAAWRNTEAVVAALDTRLGAHNAPGAAIIRYLAFAKGQAQTAAVTPALRRSPEELRATVADTLALLHRARARVEAVPRPPSQPVLQSLDGAVEQTAQWAAALADDDQAARRLSAAVMDQHVTVAEAVAELDDVLGRRQTSSTPQVLEAYVQALARSVGKDQGAIRALERARKAARRQALDLVDEALDVLDVTDERGLTELDHLAGADPDAARRARGQRKDLERRKARQEAQLAHGGTVSAAAQDDLILDAREYAFDTKVVSIARQGLNLAGVLDGLDDGFLGWLANGTDKLLPLVVDDLRGLSRVVVSIRNHYRERLADFHGGGGRGLSRDSEVWRQERLAAIEEAEGRLGDWLATGHFAERLRAAYERVESAQIRLLIVNLGVQLGLTLAGMGAGALAARGATALASGRGIAAGASTAVEVAEAAALAARTARVGAVAGAVTDTAVNLAGQKLVLGDQTSVITLGAINLSSMLVIGRMQALFGDLDDLSRQTAQLATRWGRLQAQAGKGAMLGLELSNELVLGAAIDYAMKRLSGDVAVAPDEQTGLEWLMQGASMALGRSIAGRLHRLAAARDQRARVRGADLAAHAPTGVDPAAMAHSDPGAHDTLADADIAHLLERAEPLLELAAKVEATGDPAAARELVNLYRVHLDAERTALAALDRANPRDGRKDTAGLPRGLPPPITTASALAAQVNQILGRPLDNLHDGHQLLRDLNRGDLGALRRLGLDVPPDLQLHGIEFGLGQLPDGSFVVVRGEHHAVDWSGLPGVVPIAHTHPLTDGNHPRVVGEDQIALVATVAPTAEPLVSREIVFPSAADLTVLGRQGVAEHTVFTNLEVHRGQAAPPGSDRASSRLEWHILDPVKVGSDPALGDVYRAHLIGEVGGRPVVKLDVWANEPASGAGNLFTRSPLPAPAPASPAPRTAEDTAHLAQRQRELTAAVGDRLGDLPLEVLPAAEFVTRFETTPGRALFLLEGDQPKLYARADATAAQVREDLVHHDQLQGPLGPDIRRLHAGGLDEWGQRSIRDRVELYRIKLAVEIDAAERLLADPAHRQTEPTGPDGHHAGEETAATLANLRALQEHVEGLTDLDLAEMSAGRRAVPDYLQSPAYLFSKARVQLDLKPSHLDDHAPRVELPRTDKERSPAWDSRADVVSVSRVGNEWREVVEVTSDHDGTVSLRADAEGRQTAIVTGADGRAHPYPLEADAELGVEEGAKVKAGQRLATERHRRYRLVEIEHATGKDHREEVFSVTGRWVQRGSESTRRGALMEEAARLQVDARLAAQGVKPLAAGAAEGYRRIPHHRGGGGFDDVIVMFSGTPDEPKAFIRIREVKDYPNRHVPLEEFSAIRPPGLTENLKALEKVANEAVVAAERGKAAPPGFEGLTVPQIEAIRHAVETTTIRIEVVLGPTTRVGREGAPRASVLKDLRQEIQAQLHGADVLAESGTGNGPERVDASFVDAAVGAEMRKP